MMIMDMEDKIRLIEDVFAFFLDAPIMETASAFPSPNDVIEDWYLSALIFRSVQEKQQIPVEHYEALHTLITEAEAEFKASAMLNEQPDTAEDLSMGYDEGEVPPGFAAKHQAAIWVEVIKVLNTDQRPSDLRIISE